jgi:hypothetical protein
MLANSEYIYICICIKVIWKITPLFAEWLSSPSNPLTPILAKSSIVELGCGISPLNALSLSHLAARYILTDQPYVQKLLLQNLAANLPSSSSSKPSSSSSSKKAHPSRSKKSTAPPKTPSPPSSSSTPLHPSNTATTTADIHFEVLDWETSQVTPALTHSRTTSSFDALVSCDCVYNYALIQPFVQTCVDICALRNKDINLRNQQQQQQQDASAAAAADDDENNLRSCLCIVAQQLRNDDVFNTWLTAFREHFRVWRVPGERMPRELRPEAGFVVHIGILKDSF